MHVIEISLPLGELSFPSFLLIRRDEATSFPNVRLVSQESFTSFQRRRILAEQFDIRGHTEVRTAVPDDVPSVVANSLNL